MTYLQLLELWNNGTIKTTEEYKKLHKKATISEEEMDWKDRLIKEAKIMKTVFFKHCFNFNMYIKFNNSHSGS